MSEIPAVPGHAGLTAGDNLVTAVEAVFSAEGPLAHRFPDFEPRDGQLTMAANVARAFEEGGVLLAEAGTGTGKTLAYLVPAILSGQRVLISTGTKNLQEQIYFKDIPVLRETLGIPFTATYMKGRANYLCLHRLDQLNEGGSGAPSHDIFLPIFCKGTATTETGDRAEIEDLPEDIAFWNEVSATTETCLGTECPRYDDCFVTRMRQRAASSDIVIVNHHLLCADAAVRQHAFGEVIPACSHAIVDEAHQLEDVATQYFGFGVSTYRVEELAKDVERLAAAGFIAESRNREEAAESVDGLRDHARTFFADLAYAHRNDERPRGEERVRATQMSLSRASDSAAGLTGAIDRLEYVLARLRPDAPVDRTDSLERSDRNLPDDNGTGAASEQIAALVRRAGELRTELRFLMRASEAEYVYFVEFRGRGVFLRASPIDVSAIIRELLLDRMRTTVLTSATLTVDGAFSYIRDRLGIRSAAELCLPSEYDFERQTLLYLPPRMPDPRSPEFSGAAGREVIQILKRTRGRAFVLFTSYATLRAVQAMAEMALDYPILAQGSVPRSLLLKRFRDTPHSVLFATSSFWQGVDVVGEALSCVIIDKLPFASPGEPVLAARIEAIRARGGEPFGEYQVPLAILALRQGLGRLIRHRRDRGVLTVLDPRLRTKGYGRRFLSSLPPAPVVDELDAVSAFLAADLV